MKSKSFKAVSVLVCLFLILSVCGVQPQKSE